MKTKKEIEEQLSAVTAEYHERRYWGGPDPSPETTHAMLIEMMVLNK